VIKNPATKLTGRQQGPPKKRETKGSKLHEKNRATTLQRKGSKKYYLLFFVTVKKTQASAHICDEIHETVAKTSTGNPRRGLHIQKGKDRPNLGH